MTAINAITRESMDIITEEIMNVMDAEWLDKESIPVEIERVLVNNGLAAVIEEEKVNVNDKYQIEVDTGCGGYGFIDTIQELIKDVTEEFGMEEADKVTEWAKNSKDGDEYKSENGRMCIWNIGD